ncbi:MAG: VOC family protein [Gemmatimonadota bacterium]
MTQTSPAPGSKPAPQKVTPFLWFDNTVEEAMTLYTSLFPNSHIVSLNRAGDRVFSGSFVLDGHTYHAFNGGPMFTFSEAFSLMVNCETQDEIDSLWTRLTADGGQESRCGWLKDKFGLSWQIVPSVLLPLLQHPDPEKAKRVQQAMLGMNKLDIKGLQEA